MNNSNEILKKIKKLEKQVYENLDFNINQYYDYCTLAYYLYGYFKNSNYSLSKSYYYKGRIILKKMLIKLSSTNYHLSNISTWNGVVGLLYIMRCFNTENDLNDKIEYLETRVLNDTVDCLNNKNLKLHDNYDLVSGLSGVGLYFLNNNYQQRHSILKKISYGLVTIILNFNEKKDSTIDYSISHGILGILYFLSKYYFLTKDKHILNVIRKVLSLYVVFIKDSTHNHIDKFPLTSKINDNGEINFFYSNRTVWCYGSVGTYRALYLISNNINDRILKSIVKNDINKFNNVSDFNLLCPTFCHGLSGVHYILSAFYKEDKTLKVKEIISDIEDKVWSSYDDKLPYFFPKFDVDGNGRTKKVYDNTSFIDGAVSIAISYLILHTDLENDYFSYSLALK